ncbi:PIN domain-containing protein [Terriglobus saanensis]|uniref:Ribonuclease VapC n=1 Tax=Terriglobus saanensis (strain ATCC BAA-1853 / DSM 23119 / SP1PR4) TaxID=401053 RepID=E8V4K7_TERSS|nr:PIN domain-containing protein [Terriglobus saanensis]ADV84831.1 PilT protein domain protein [Terriglobus saanensis SP1PR4]
MGLIVDTSVLIRAERAEVTLVDLLFRIGEAAESGSLFLSAITILELVHGVARARTEVQRNRRENFLKSVESSAGIYPVESSIARRAGLLNGELRGRGFTIVLADSIIASTALIYGHGVLTHNVRHFTLVPELRVVEAGL